MKAYLVTTAIVFGLLVVAHVARIVAEGQGVLNPFFVIVTVISAALCTWAVVLLRRPANR